MQKGNINGFNIFDNAFLYIACTDGTTFFLKDKKYAIELMKTFDTLSGLKSNKRKCQIAD